MKPVVLPELRYRRLWFILGLAIAVAITIACLVPGRELPETGISDKYEHVIAFAVLGFWFGSIVVRRDYFWLALALVLFGALIEVAQGLMGLGRNADIKDLYADSVGVGLGLLVALTPAARWVRWLEVRAGRTNQ